MQRRYRQQKGLLLQQTSNLRLVVKFTKGWFPKTGSYCGNDLFTLSVKVRVSVSGPFDILTLCVSSNCIQPKTVTVIVNIGLVTVRNSSCGKIMFSQSCVTGGCLPHCMLGYTTPPPWADPPLPDRPP